MVSDILLSNRFSSCWEDQKQHLELARDLAERFNNRYMRHLKFQSLLFIKLAQELWVCRIQKAKCLNQMKWEWIYTSLDKPDAIKRKIKRAVTDSHGEVKYRDEQPGIKT